MKATKHKKPDRLLTIREAALSLELDATLERPERWLRRRLLRLQTTSRFQILIPVGEGTKRPTYRVRESALRIVLPELYGRHNVLDEVNARLKTLERVGTTTEALVEDLRADVVAVAHRSRDR